jgi:hypothetical protein
MSTASNSGSKEQIGQRIVFFDLNIYQGINKYTLANNQGPENNVSWQGRG